jgi:DeoR/GlpR family transcriptional regulator of sugar metabolism
VTVVADHTKWGTVGLCSFADLSEVDTLITDDGLQPEARALVGDRVGKLVIANAAERTHPGPDSTADRIARQTG